MSNYPSFNDREFDLLKKICNSTAELADGSGIPLTKAEADLLYAKLGSVLVSGLTMPTSRLLGRSTAGTGAIEDISLASSLSLAAGVLSVSGIPWNSIVTKSVDFIIATSDKGAIFHVTTGVSAITATLPAAATAGNGWYVFIRKIDAGAGNVVTNPATSMLAISGHTVLVYTDGVSYFERDWFGGINSTGDISVTASGSHTLRGGGSAGGSLVMALDGSISLTAAGSNKNITLLPSGSGYVGIQDTAIPAATSTQVTLNVNRVLQVGFFASTPTIMGVRAQGSLGAATAVGNGNTLVGFSGQGYDSSAYATGASMSIVATETWSGSARGTEFQFFTIANGTTSFGQKMYLRNYGKLDLQPVAGSLAAWSTTGALLSSASATITDTSSATGTVASAVMRSFTGGVINATNASVVYTDLANAYFTPPTAAGNASATNLWAIWSTGKIRTDDNVQISTTKVLNFGAIALGNIGVSADTTAGILQIKSPTSGTTALYTANALSLTLSGGAAATVTGGAGNMTIVSGTGASRTMIFQTTTSGSTATTALTLSATQTATFASSITTGAPNTGSAGAWKLGILVTTTSVFDTTKYIQLDVGGTLYKLATCT